MAGTLRKLFFSAVSKELGSYRLELDRRLRDCFHVHTQEHFSQAGGRLLDHLDDYIKSCDAVVHLVGDDWGASPTEAEAKALLDRYPSLKQKVGAQPELSYTQWEGVLALHHRKLCFVWRPEPSAPRDPGFSPSDQERQRQAEHFARIAAGGQHYGSFEGPADLALQVWSALARAGLIQDAAREKPINLPRPIGSLFKGRREFVAQLRESLACGGSGATVITPGPAVLHGLGGVGKTRAAIEYGWQHEAEYDALLFLEADSPQALHANLAELVGPLVLNLPAQHAREQAEQVNAALGWLRTHRKWFLVIDNVDSEDTAREVEKLVGSLRSGHVLITSRLSNWGAGVTPLELDVLREDDAVELLLERAGRGAEEREGARALARELDGLALGVEQAAAYVRSRKSSLAQYLSDFRERSKRPELLAWVSERMMQYPRSVALTWQTSVNALSPEARTLLELVAFLAPDPIPRSLLSVPGHGLARPEEALADLAAYSLAALEAQRFRVHRLVQEVTRHELEHANNARDRLRAVLGWVGTACVGEDPDDVRSLPVLEPLQPHAEAVAARADTGGLVSGRDATAFLKNQLGLLLHRKALYGQAEPLYRRALAIYEKSLGEDHPNVAASLSNLAVLLEDTNRLMDAEPLLRRALAIYEKSMGEDHPRVASSLNNLATLLQATNRLADAEPLFRRALAINEKSLGPHHHRVARDLNNLATLLYAARRPAEAEPLLRRALAITERSLGKEHPSVAANLNNLAALLHATDRLTDAEPLVRRALAITERFLGMDHPDVAIGLNNVAQLLRATNRHADAEPLYRRALAIDEKSLGKDHPSVATDLNNLAALLKATNRLTDAEPLMRRALRILFAFTRSTGHAHPSLELVRGNYATLLQELDKSPEAIEQAVRAIALEQ